MNTLYHGSYTKVETPSVCVGRRNLDFGKGFYLTNLKTQAEIWAILTGGRHNDEDWGIVNVYEFDYEVLTKYKVLSFPEYNMQWLDFVVKNRHGEDSAQMYDAVEGGVANDQVIDTVEDYENGRITAEQALDQLRFNKPTHQICIRTQEIIDKCLHFKTCYTVKDQK